MIIGKRFLVKVAADLHSAPRGPVSESTVDEPCPGCAGPPGGARTRSSTGPPGRGAGQVAGRAAAQLAGTGRHDPALRGARAGRRGLVPGCPGSCSGTPCVEQAEQGVDFMTIHAGRAAAVHPAARRSGHRHRVPGRLGDGRVVRGAPRGELPLHALRGAVRDLLAVRRDVLARQRAAFRLGRRRQRPRPARRAAYPRRTRPHRVAPRRPGDRRGAGARAAAPDQGDRGPAAGVVPRGAVLHGRSGHDGRGARGTTRSAPRSARRCARCTVRRCCAA